MRKCLIPLIILLCVSIASAGNLQKKVIARKNAVPAGCGGTQTWTGDPGDTETFEFQEGDFCTTEWAETDPDTIISTYDNTTVKNGTYAVSIALDGANREDNYVQANTGGGDGDYSFDFWYYLYDVADWNGGYIMSATSSGTPSDINSFGLKHNRQNAGNAQIEVDSAADDSSVNLTTNAWYRIEVDYNKNGASTVEIYNAAEALQDTLNFTAFNTDSQYFAFGCIFSNANMTETAYYDDVRYKSSGGGF